MATQETRTKLQAVGTQCGGRGDKQGGGDMHTRPHSGEKVGMERRAGGGGQKTNGPARSQRRGVSEPARPTGSGGSGRLQLLSRAEGLPYLILESVRRLPKASKQSHRKYCFLSLRAKSNVSFQGTPPSQLFFTTTPRPPRAPLLSLTSRPSA